MWVFVDEQFGISSTLDLLNYLEGSHHLAGPIGDEFWLLFGFALFRHIVTDSQLDRVHPGIVDTLLFLSLLLIKVQPPTPALLDTLHKRLGVIVLS